MRIFWWNGGLHVEPETDAERTALVTLTESRLVVIQSSGQVDSGPIGAVAVHDKQSVGSVHVLPQEIT